MGSGLQGCRWVLLRMRWLPRCGITCKYCRPHFHSAAVDARQAPVTSQWMILPPPENAGDQGKQLEKKAAEATWALRPRHTFVPWCALLGLVGQCACLATLLAGALLEGGHALLPAAGWHFLPAALAGSRRFCAHACMRRPREVRPTWSALASACPTPQDGCEWRGNWQRLRQTIPVHLHSLACRPQARCLLRPA